jgi:hypothetical protein
MQTTFINSARVGTGSDGWAGSRPPLRFASHTAAVRPRLPHVAHTWDTVWRGALRASVQAISTDRRPSVRNLVYGGSLAVLAAVALIWPATSGTPSETSAVRTVAGAGVAGSSTSIRSVSAEVPRDVAATRTPSVTTPLGAQPVQPQAGVQKAPSGVPLVTASDVPPEVVSPKAPLTPPTATQARAGKRSAAPVGAAGTRTPRFAWAPAPGATAYVFALYRGAKRVYHTKISSPVIELPASWKSGGAKQIFGPGAYQWVVWVVRNGRQDAAAVVRSKVVVPAR